MNSLHYSPTPSASNPLHTHIINPPTPSPSPSAATIPLKRTRAKRSCDFCRKRKSRCDADTSIPCSNCKAVCICHPSANTQSEKLELTDVCLS
ncbi:hypothetical protein BJV82DRAFT_609584 [Fennellomyces sp. T-0311]|nr:hypothetical protein BJV82DRAFT_609584 [Fennellomyces sp. T-0311]